MAKRHLVSIDELRREKKRELRRGTRQATKQDLEPFRPKTRSDCKDAPRPCPWVGCRYHLFLDVTKKGSVLFPHGTTVDDLAKMPETCALDIAERGENELSALHGLFGLSEFGSRLVVNSAMAALSARRKLAELAPEGPVSGWRRGLTNAHVHQRVAATKEALRAFYDAPLERKEVLS